MHNKTMSFSLIVGLLIGTLLLVGCQVAAPAPAPAEKAVEEEVVVEEEAVAEEPAEAEAPAEEAEQVLRILHPAFDMDWSPLRGGGHPTRLLSLWWAAPMYFDAKGELQPSVFNEWSPNDDFTLWTFKVDPNAVFSDGSPITAEDVKGTWDLSAHPATMHQRVDLFLSGVEGFDAVKTGEAQEMAGLVVKDPQTLEVTLTAPDPIFYQKIATHLISPVKISQVIGDDGEEVVEWWHPKNGVVSSGPFMPETMDLDRGELVFVRNPNFFGPAPKLDKITITFVEDSQSATTMLENGEADLHTYISTPTLIDDLGVGFVAGPDLPKAHNFWLDASKEPTSDINVRKALIMAINPEDLIKASYPNGPNPMATQILNAVPGADDPTYESFPFDPEAAKEALAASSYGGAENLPKIMMVGISYPAAEAAAQYIAEQWRQVLGIEAVDMKPQYDDYSGPDQENIQIFRDDVGSRVPDAVSYLQGSIHSSSGNAIRKMGGYANPEIDALIDEAATKGTDDPDRIAMAQEAQRLFREDWMFIPWAIDPSSPFAMPWVKNAERNPDWQIAEPWNVTIEK
jgi:peptide/nickel transport system substrate-binding protein